MKNVGYSLFYTFYGLIQAINRKLFLEKPLLFRDIMSNFA